MASKQYICYISNSYYKMALSNDHLNSKPSSIIASCVAINLATTKKLFTMQSQPIHSGISNTSQKQPQLKHS